MKDSNVAYSPFGNCLASPLYCQRLYKLGIKPNQIFIAWVTRQGITTAESLWFDTDNYYRDALAAINYIHPPEYMYPALTIGDLSLLLPEHTISVEAGYYHCRLNGKWPGVAHISSIRMPDAMAIMLEQCISKGIVNIDNINTYLQAQIKNNP